MIDQLVNQTDFVCLCSFLFACIYACLFSLWCETCLLFKILGIIGCLSNMFGMVYSHEPVIVSISSMSASTYLLLLQHHPSNLDSAFDHAAGWSLQWGWRAEPRRGICRAAHQLGMHHQAERCLVMVDHWFFLNITKGSDDLHRGLQLLLSQTYFHGQFKGSVGPGSYRSFCGLN